MEGRYVAMQNKVLKKKDKCPRKRKEENKIKR
jgi:hypothetical protein